MHDPADKPRTLILPPVPFAVALAGGWWLDRHWLALPLTLGGWAPLLGGALVAAGLLLLGWTLWTFRRHHTTVNPYAGASALCTSGPFRFSRNPIYLGDFVLLAGLALHWQTVWPLLATPLLWALIRYSVIRHEEAHLQAKFGMAYRDYCARVRRWL
jgi:protein-S-isoprenylcysteine O-methyltransferase Ste14